MQKYINEILLRINEEMELRGIDENVNTEDALYMIDVIRPLFEKLREMTIAYEFQSEQEEIHFFKEIKPDILGRYIFFHKVVRIEMKRPIGSDDVQRGVICLSEFSGVGKLHDEKLQAGNEVVRLIDEYNKTHKMQCQSLSDLGLKPVGDNFYEYKGMWFLLDANDKAFELRFRSPYGGDINYDFTYSSDVQEWDDTLIW